MAVATEPRAPVDEARLGGALLLVVPGVAAEWAERASTKLLAAGATVRTLHFTDGWADLGQPGRLEALAALVGSGVTVADAAPRAAAALADVLAGRRTDDELVGAVEDLIDAGLLATDGPLPVGDAQIVVTAPEHRAPIGNVAMRVVARLAEVAPGRVLAAQGLPPLPERGADAADDELPESESSLRASFVGAVRSTPELAARVSTIDHLDQDEGVDALVLALGELRRGQVGHYGRGVGASGLRPAPARRAPAPQRGRLATLVTAPLRAPAESWVGALIVLACMGFVFSQLHPDLIFAKTTPAGGDMGAHVWGPAYLRDHLLNHGRLTGWTPDWYAGFPAFQFYMLPPALLILLFNLVLPYGVAFKVVTILGVVSMPLAAYVMGRLFRLPFPGPPLLAVATLPFLFDRTWTIYGGNVASTLAGEYSFSISLSLALVFFGVFARGLETGRYRALGAVLLSLVILCHAIPAFFAMLGALVLLLLRFDRHRLVYAVPVIAVGGLLTAFWSIPFVLRRGLLTDMGWEKLEDYRSALLPQATRWVFVLALVGLVLAMVFWIRLGAFFAILGALCAAGFVFDAAGHFHIWNARLLPFYYLALYLLAAVGVSEVLRSLAVIVDARIEWRRRLAESAGAVLALGGALILVALPLHVLPGGELRSDGTYHWMFLDTHDDSFVDSWARWNYEGYERKASYPEYRSIISTMKELGQTDGCGRAHWEYDADLNRYGTPMAMMLLPFWTDGCIGSMEGLYFESSGTTPFHFLNASETSAAPSNPVRSTDDRPMPYPGFDLDKGVRHLQMFGVKYYLAFSAQAIEAADRHPDLTEVASSPPWKVYEVAGSELVSPLANEPAVLEGMSERNPAWQKDAVEWYTNPDDLDVFLAPNGPKEWQRVQRGEEPERRPLPKTKVSNIHEGDLAISFDVDRTGEPILVKTSYFPNWKVSGAKGVYHVTPNLMVVIPTEKHVRLSYGYTGVDELGYGLTGLALVGLVLLLKKGRVRFPPPKDQRLEGPPAPDGQDPAGWTPADRPEDGEPEAAAEPAPTPAPVGFWDSILAERKAELAEAEQRTGDAPGDGGAGGASLLDPDRDLGHDDPGPLGS